LLQKQRTTIEKLEKEKEELLTTLGCVKSNNNEMKDTKNTSKLKKLLEHQEQLDQTIRYEKSQLGELQFQVGLGKSHTKLALPKCAQFL